jgi:hypothetical protein
MSVLKLSVFALASTLLLSALDAQAAFGRTKPVYNVVDKPIRAASGRQLDLDEVEVLLRSAAEFKGWKVNEEGDGHLSARINVRTHYAEIDIHFTAENYSITYRDSRELMYDGEKIHRNYNKWIKLIEENVDERLSLE